MEEIIKNVSDKELNDLISNFINNPNKNNLIIFLKEYKKRLQFYIDNKVSTENIADLAINIFVSDDKFFNSLEKFDKEALELIKAMDITHPSWTNEHRNEYIKNLILLCDKLIKKHS